MAATDTGLTALVSLLRLQGVAAEPAQLHHQLGLAGKPVGVVEMVRCARQLGLKARMPVDPLGAAGAHAAARHRRTARRLLPGAGQGDRRQGAGPHAGRLPGRDHVAAAVRGGVDRPAGADDAPRPAWRRRSAVRHRLVRRARSTSIAACSARCCSASFFLQLFALLTPLFFQVVIDKVLVHRSLTTLDVLVVGLVGVRRVRDRARHPAHLPVRAHHQPHRRRARRAAVPPPDGAADRLFPGPPRRRFGGARARAREHPQVPHQLGADPGHRPVLHLRLPRGDVLLLAAADADRARRLSRSTSASRWP